MRATQALVYAFYWVWLWISFIFFLCATAAIGHPTTSPACAMPTPPLSVAASRSNPALCCTLILFRFAHATCSRRRRREKLWWQCGTRRRVRKTFWHVAVRWLSLMAVFSIKECMVLTLSCRWHGPKGQRKASPTTAWRQVNWCCCLQWLWVEHRRWRWGAVPMAAVVVVVVEVLSGSGGWGSWARGRCYSDSTKQQLEQARPKNLWEKERGKMISIRRPIDMDESNITYIGVKIGAT